MTPTNEHIYQFYIDYITVTTWAIVITNFKYKIDNFWTFNYYPNNSLISQLLLANRFVANHISTFRCLSCISPWAYTWCPTHFAYAFLTSLLSWSNLTLMCLYVESPVHAMLFVSLITWILWLTYPLQGIIATIWLPAYQACVLHLRTPSFAYMCTTCCLVPLYLCFFSCLTCYCLAPMSFPCMPQFKLLCCLAYLSYAWCVSMVMSICYLLRHLFPTCACYLAFPPCFLSCTYTSLHMHYQAYAPYICSFACDQYSHSLGMPNYVIFRFFIESSMSTQCTYLPLIIGVWQLVTRVWQIKVKLTPLKPWALVH